MSSDDVSDLPVSTEVTKIELEKERLDFEVKRWESQHNLDRERLDLGKSRGRGLPTWLVTVLAALFGLVDPGIETDLVSGQDLLTLRSPALKWML